MQLVVVDVLGAEPLQTGLERTADPRRVAIALTLGEPHGVTPLRGDQDVRATTGERRTEELLRLPASVALGGVEVVDPGVDRGVDDRTRPFGVDHHPEVVAAESDDGDVEHADLASLHERRS